jgi:hypothetical protein
MKRLKSRQVNRYNSIPLREVRIFFVLCSILTKILDRKFDTHPFARTVGDPSVTARPLTPPAVPVRAPDRASPRCKGIRPSREPGAARAEKQKTPALTGTRGQRGGKSLAAGTPADAKSRRLGLSSTDGERPRSELRSGRIQDPGSPETPTRRVSPGKTDVWDVEENLNEQGRRNVPGSLLFGCG